MVYPHFFLLLSNPGIVIVVKIIEVKLKIHYIMALSLHTTKKYNVEYGKNAINGWSPVAEFIEFLRELQRDENGCDYIFINDGETEVEIPFYIVEKYKNHEKWGEVFTTIWDECDHNNSYAFLNIW